jgi:hypothetical protein
VYVRQVTEDVDLEARARRREHHALHRLGLPTLATTKRGFETPWISVFAQRPYCSRGKVDDTGVVDVERQEP